MASDRKRKLAQVDAHRPPMPRKQPLIFTREDDWEDNLLHLPVDTAAQAGEREAEMVKRLTCTQSTFAATSTMLTPPAELGNSREELASLQSDALLKAAKITELNNCLVISSSQRRSPQDDVAGLETDVANFSTKIGTLETENVELNASRDRWKRALQGLLQAHSSSRAMLEAFCETTNAPDTRYDSGVQFSHLLCHLLTATVVCRRDRKER
jgi:hypothetical protein